MGDFKKEITFEFTRPMTTSIDHLSGKDMRRLRRKRILRKEMGRK